jgi:glycine/D-amino acid oxidase-like deaminating enzyme/nitrite reductase/ring-hydroxylating ferredoxin subunit
MPQYSGSSISGIIFLIFYKMISMKRDGFKTSLWQHQIPDYISKAKTLRKKDFDVLIVGGGVTGIAAALQLQKSGLQCIVAEANNLCFGTTGGTTAHLNTFLDNDYSRIEKDFGEEGAQLIAKATSQALDLYHANVEEYNIDCGYEQKDGYLYSQDEKQTEELNKIFEASKKAGVDVAYTDRIPVPVEFEKAIVYHEQANIHPSKYVYALAKAFEENGGVILQDCMVKDFKGDKVLEVETSQGTINTRILIWATHIPPGVNLLHFRCAPYRSYVIAATLNNNAYPDGLAYDMYDPYHYYRTQNVDGKKYLIVGGEDHKTAHEENTEGCFNRLAAHVRKYFDVKEIAFKWSSQYFEPADGLAYIGHLPGNPDNVLVATGYGGNGMTYSHMAALTLTDLIVKGESEFAKLFDPDRLKPIAGFANFIKENADVVKEFIGKRLSKEKLNELSDIAPGEAKLVKYEGKSLALYKDEEGEIHAVSPVCPHAKCAVGWNSAEKSWDCPCHGSRFTIDGEVLTGPATQGLEVIGIESLVHEKH